jgi:release factor glutamine methyltransferase
MAEESATAKMLMHEIGDRLQSINRYRAFAEARILLASILGCDPDRLLMEDDQLISAEQQNELEKLVSRRLNYEPIAYLIRQKEFYGLKFFVDPSVLIPRPETESLVGGILKWVKSKNLTSGTILDLGTGSGCIAIALAKELGSSFKIVGLDKSEVALQVCEKNQKQNKLTNLSWISGDILAEPKMAENFNVIVCNPPYIPTANFQNLQEDIRNFEPREALDGGESGINFYQAIFSKWLSKIAKPGLLAIETMGPSQQEELKSAIQIKGHASNWSDGPHLFYEY